MAPLAGATRKVQNRHLDERTLGQVDAGAANSSLRCEIFGGDVVTPLVGTIEVEATHIQFNS